MASATTPASGSASTSAPRTRPPSCAGRTATPGRCCSTARRCCRARSTPSRTARCWSGATRCTRPGSTRPGSSRTRSAGQRDGEDTTVQLGDQAVTGVRHGRGGAEPGRRRGGTGQRRPADRPDRHPDPPGRLGRRPAGHADARPPRWPGCPTRPWWPSRSRRPGTSSPCWAAPSRRARPWSCTTSAAAPSTRAWWPRPERGRLPGAGHRGPDDVGGVDLDAALLAPGRDRPTGTADPEAWHRLERAADTGRPPPPPAPDRGRPGGQGDAVPGTIGDGAGAAAGA